MANMAILYEWDILNKYVVKQHLLQKHKKKRYILPEAPSGLKLSSNPSTWCSDPMNFPQQAVGMTNILFKAIPSSGPLAQTAKNNLLIPSTQRWPKGAEDQNTTPRMTSACSVTPQQGSEVSVSSP